MDLGGGVPLLGRGVLVVGEDPVDDRPDRPEDLGALHGPWWVAAGCGSAWLEGMPDGLAGVPELPGDLSDGHAIASSPPDRAIVVHREHVLGLRMGDRSLSRNVHRNEGGWGGLFLDDHLALGWAPLTRSFPLVGRLSEGPLQGRAIGHAHSGPIDEPGPMTMPQPDGVVQGFARVDETLEKRLEDGQGEPGSGLAVGRGGELEAAQAWQMGAGGIVVEDLEDEQMDGRHRVEDAVTPTATHGMTEGLQVEWFEPVGQIGADLS